MGDDRLFRREFKPSFLQKLFNEGFDLSFQYFLRFAGDDEVVCVSDEIHRSGFTSERLETFLLRELLLQEPLKPVQRAICERWRNNSALWSSFRRFVKNVFIHIPGFQPLLENGSIHGDVSQKPIVGNFVEAGFDIALQNPLRARCGSQRYKALCNRIGAGPLLTKPVRVFISRGFHDGIER